MPSDGVVLSLWLALSLPALHSAEDGTQSRTLSASINTRLTENFVIVPEYKLMLCYVEKVACKNFNRITCMLRAPELHGGKGCNSHVWFRNTPAVHGLQLQDLKRMLVDPAWHKAVFYREPLERFASAFSSKCEQSDGDGAQICTGALGANSTVPKRDVMNNMSERIRRFAIAATRLASPRRFDRHFQPQSLFCGGLGRSLDRYDTVERLDRDTSHIKVDALLARVGVNESERARVLAKTFPLPVRRRLAHDTYASRRLLAYYETPKIVRQVVRFFVDDYLLFGIALPVWARNLLASSDIIRGQQQ